jgi:co-chaperonin GroES (HSP10)
MSSTIINEKELKSYNAAIAADCPIKALVNRVIVIQLIEEELPLDELAGGINLPPTDKLDSGIFILKSTKVKEAENKTVKAVVKSVGPTNDGRVPTISANDIVFVFPSVFETLIHIDNADYFVYSERDIVAVAK